MSVQIREERPGDEDAVRAVHRAAFAKPGNGVVAEARLVDELRRGPWWLPHLALVAVVDDAVVGHVVATRATVHPAGAAVLGLGPLGVLPEWQGQGVGSALVRALLSVAAAHAEAMVVLLGDPRFYVRFGFAPSTDHGITAPDPRWGREFQAIVLGGPVEPGAFRYAEPFDRLPE